MSTSPYKVKLDVFDGPLDLLLFLVRRNEVSPIDLPIAEITHQFEHYLSVLEFIDLDLVGDFIVMASTLIEIKSRLVLPRQEDEEETVETDDNRSDLIKRLLEYKKYKEAAKALEEQAAEWQERYPRLTDERPVTSKNPSTDRIKEVELWDLVSALARVVERKVIEEETSIRYDDTPISVYVEQIGRRVREEGRVEFRSFFDKESLRSKIVGIFLAILELLRNYGFRAEQLNDFAEIWVLPPLEPQESTEDSELLRDDADAEETATE